MNLSNKKKKAVERAARQDLQKMRGKVSFWPNYRKDLYGSEGE